MRDATQIYYKDCATGQPVIFSRGLPLSANARESQTKMAKNKIPRHVGFIPDGNRRWAADHRLPREAGYVHGINPGLLLYEKCKELGIEEVSIYGFTQDNTKRPSIQKQAFSEACVVFAFEIARRGAALLVVGDETSTQFPKVLTEFRHRQGVHGEFVK